MAPKLNPFAKPFVPKTRDESEVQPKATISPEAANKVVEQVFLGILEGLGFLLSQPIPQPGVNVYTNLKAAFMTWNDAFTYHKDKPVSSDLIYAGCRKFQLTLQPLVEYLNKQGRTYWSKIISIIRKQLTSPSGWLTMDSANIKPIQDCIQYFNNQDYILVGRSLGQLMRLPMLKIRESSQDFFRVMDLPNPPRLLHFSHSGDDFVYVWPSSGDGDSISYSSTTSHNRVIYDIELASKLKGLPYVNKVSFSKNSRYVAVSRETDERNYKILLHDISSNTTKELGEFCQPPVMLFLPSSKGQILGLACGGKQTSEWVQGKMTLYELINEGANSIGGCSLPRGASCMAFSPKGRYFACGGPQTNVGPTEIGRLDLVDLQMKEGKVMFDFTEPIKCLSFSPSENLLAAASSGSLQLYDLSSKAYSYNDISNTKMLAFTACGRWLILTTPRQVLRYELSVLPDTPPHKVIFSTNGDNKSDDIIEMCILSPTGNHIAIATKSRSYLSIINMELIDAAPTKLSPVNVFSVVFSPSGRYLATNRDHQHILLYDLKKHVSIVLALGPNELPTLSFSSSGKLLTAVGQRDSYVYNMQLLPGREAWVLALLRLRERRGLINQSNVMPSPLLNVLLFVVSPKFTDELFELLCSFLY